MICMYIVHICMNNQLYNHIIPSPLDIKQAQISMVFHIFIPSSRVRKTRMTCATRRGPKLRSWLVGSWTTPLKNMSSSVWIMIPNIWKNKKCSKPPVDLFWSEIYGFYGILWGSTGCVSANLEGLPSSTLSTHTTI